MNKIKKISLIVVVIGILVTATSFVMAQVPPGSTEAAALQQALDLATYFPNLVHTTGIHLGSVTSPDVIGFNCSSVGGVQTCRQSANLTNRQEATSTSIESVMNKGYTVCTLPWPSASSTLLRSSFLMSSSTVGAVTVYLGFSTSTVATTTLLENYNIAAALPGTSFVWASTTNLVSTTVTRAATSTLPLSQWNLNWGVKGMLTAGASDARCTAEWQIL